MVKEEFKDFLIYLNEKYRIDELEEPVFLGLIDNLYLFYNGEEVVFESLEDEIVWSEMLPELVLNFGGYPDEMNSQDEGDKKNLFFFTPEWILENMGDSWFANGNGMGIVSTTEKFTRVWIEYAFYTLDIGCGRAEYLINSFERIDYFFSLDDIKDSCPEFYEKLLEDNQNE